MKKCKLIKLTERKYAFMFCGGRETVLVRMAGQLNLPQRVNLPPELIGKRVRIFAEVEDDK